MRHLSVPFQVSFVPDHVDEDLIPSVLPNFTESVTLDLLIRVAERDVKDEKNAAGVFVEHRRDGLEFFLAGGVHYPDFHGSALFVGFDGDEV